MRLALVGALALFLTAGTAAEPQVGLGDWLRSNGFGPHSNVMCGIPPIPPIGCKVGVCVCDQNGLNCRWTFVCG